jgi:phage tail sheath protein FI
MAEKLVSPGVFTRENDLSFIAQGVGAIGGAIVGPFKQGPAFKPTIITSPSELEDIFGAADGTYYTELTAQNYLRETGLVTICRVAGIGGYTEKAPVLVTLAGPSGSTNTIVSKSVGLLFNTDTDTNSFSTTFSSSVAGYGNVSFGGLTLSGSYATSLVPTSTQSIDDVFGTSPLGEKEAYVYGYFSAAATDVYNSFFSASISGGVTTQNSLQQFASASFVTLGDQNFTYDATYASTPWVQSQDMGGLRYDLFRFHTLADGNIENTRFKVTIGNIKAAGDNGSDYGTFSILVRDFNDTDKRKTILEQYNNVNLDPSSTNYIARVIGDTYSTIDEYGKITTTGDWTNKSKYIRIETKDSDLYPVTAVPYAHAAYENFISGSSVELANLPGVTFTTASVSSSIYTSGINFDNADNTLFLKPLTETLGYNGNNSVFSLDTYVGLPLSANANANIVSYRTFTIAFQGGFDGLNPTIPSNKGIDISQTNVQGLDLSTSTASGSVGYKKCLDALSNTDEWDINLLVLPGVNHLHHSSVTQYAMDMCENRADTFYIMDPAGLTTNSTQGIADVIAVAESLDTNYAAVYYPWLKTIDTNTGKLITVPPSVLLPRVYAANDATSAEWFAPAGLNRGGVIGAAAVLDRLTHADRDRLYEGKVNPIAQFPGQGISAFGQKTLQSRPSALDRINVRRLLITVKKFIASTSRFLIFEQNTTDTRNSFLNTVNPYLESIQQRQGLFAFRVVMDDTNNTPDVIDRNILKGAIFLQPTKTAEFIQIDFNVLPTGASFNA